MAGALRALHLVRLRLNIGIRWTPTRVAAGCARAGSRTRGLAQRVDAGGHRLWQNPSGGTARGLRALHSTLHGIVPRHLLGP